MKTFFFCFFSLTIACVLHQAKADNSNSTELWFGATPAKKTYPLHRRGWERCNRCGGSGRMGAIVDIGRLQDLDEEGAAEIIDAVRAHGMIVIKGQNLTR